MSKMSVAPRRASRVASRGLALALLAVASSACGSDPAPVQSSACEGTIDSYAAGMTRPSEAGAFQVELRSSTLVPPDRGDNGFTFRVLDAAGAPVPDAQVVVRPWMPNHGHGSTPETFAPRMTAEPDVLEVGPIKFFMPGLWELRFQIVSPSMAKSERATFGFCVEG